ncbi:MAG: hypothetical protein WHS82_05515 [Candidatus Methanosuratincola sp.]
MGSLKRIWADAKEATVLEITSQELRFWFANEMSGLGVADRFIDAFQGIVPRSVLARNYMEFIVLFHLCSCYNNAKVLNYSAYETDNY